MNPSPTEWVAVALPTVSHPDLELASAVLRRDPDAVEAFIQRFRAAIFRYLWNHTGRKDDAEDLASQAILRAVRDLPGYRGQGPLAAWMFRVAHRELLRHRRWQKRGRRELELADVPPPNMDALVIADALAKLSSGHRSAFLLTEVEGLSVSEAALVLGIPDGTVKSRCFHAKKRLRVLLESTYLEKAQ